MWFLISAQRTFSQEAIDKQGHKKTVHLGILLPLLAFAVPLDSPNIASIGLPIAAKGADLQFQHDMPSTSNDTLSQLRTLWLNTRNTDRSDSNT
jgi:hypothetical protein